ncbi:MAG: hypothetical protein RLZZ306_2385 [Bacteroidota bacterium]
MNIPLIIYRISGWLITITEISLAIFAMTTKRMWQGKYIFIAIYLCFNAFSDIVSLITATLSVNNLFLSNIVSPMNFTMKALFLREQQRNQFVRLGVILIIIVFVSINIINSFYLNKFKEISTIGLIINRSFFLIFTVRNLTLMFRNRSNLNKLRQNPDFWFTATMFCFAFMGLMTTVLTDVSYAAGSDMVLYILFISENLIDVGIYWGYYRAIKLLR